ncbi:MAG TPA: hypothetical protein VHH09_08230 [Acidimicrobiales bacterium]|nr:hypothetical protein [Acidimicrobiales bacterium]
MRRLIVLLTAVLLAAGACGDDSAGGSGGGDAVVPGPGQTFVTGAIERFQAEDAVAPTPLGTPFTLSALERGAGGATIENALVGGRRSTISWGTGTPLPISGGGGLDLGPVAVEVDAGGVTWRLDGAARTFVPGAYRAGAPVAVGSAGLAAPREAVDFQAGPDTVFSSHGGVVARLDRRPVQLEGPGKISVSGRLEVRTAKGVRAATTVNFGPGPFTATLSPTASGYTIESVLQGPVNVK